MSNRHKAAAPRKMPRSTKSRFKDAAEQVMRGYQALFACRNAPEINAIVNGWQAKILEHPVKTMEDALAAIDYAMETYYGSKQTRHALGGARAVVKREIERAEARK